MLRMPYEQYRAEYFHILEALDPERVAEDLAALAHPHEPVLLCWDREQFLSQNAGSRMVRARVGLEGTRDLTPSPKEGVFRWGPPGASSMPASARVRLECLVRNGPA
jgi:hypothetical protein